MYSSDAYAIFIFLPQPQPRGGVDLRVDAAVLGMVSRMTIGVVLTEGIIMGSKMSLKLRSRCIVLP